MSVCLCVGPTLSGYKVGDRVKVSGRLQLQHDKDVCNPRQHQLDLVVVHMHTVHRAMSLGQIPLPGPAVPGVSGTPVPAPLSSASTPLPLPGVNGLGEAAEEDMYRELTLDDIWVVEDATELEIGIKGLIISLLEASRQGFPVALGVDAEWVPHEHMIPGTPQRVCILQLASRTKALVIDLIAWRKRHGDQAQALLDLHVGALLQRTDILKVGFAIAADIKMLRESFPEARCFDIFKDLSQAHQAYTDITSIMLARDKLLPRSQRLGPNCGLSRACAATLGRRLDKTQQTSNWSQRPLSREQLLYAARDAQVLVRLYETLGPSLAEEGRTLFLKRQEHARRVSGTPRRVSPRTAARGAAPDSSLQGGAVATVVDKDVARHLRKVVGQPVSGRGRDAVVLSIAGHLGTCPSSAGCVEIARPRVLALLVNIGYGRYRNDLRYRDDGGALTMSWWTTEKDISKSRILSRIVAGVESVEAGSAGDLGAGAAPAAASDDDLSHAAQRSGEVQEERSAEAEEDLEHEFVVLFCRLKGAGYVNMGERSVLSHLPSCTRRMQGSP